LGASPQTPGRKKQHSSALSKSPLPDFINDFKFSEVLAVTKT